MNEQLKNVRQKVFFVLFLASFLLLGSAKVYSQTNSGLAISWDKEVGCQTYDYDDRKKVFIEDNRRIGLEICDICLEIRGIVAIAISFLLLY